MGVDRAITVRLEETDYERLEAKAARLGVRTGTLARVYVRAALERDDLGDNEQLKRGVEALDRLADIRAGRPGEAAVDAVNLALEGRSELARRSGM